MAKYTARLHTRGTESQARRMDELTSFSNEPFYRRFLAIADKIERDPALLATPLHNIARRLAHPEPLARNGASNGARSLCTPKPHPKA